MMLLVVFVAGSQLSKLRVDMSDEGFLHEDDPILTTYLDFRSQFGRDDLIVLAIESDAIFQQEFLTKLAKLHHLLEDELPHVDDITSMVNARNTYGVKGGIVVDDLLEKWPSTQDDFTALKERVMNNPLYIDRLISADGRLTTVLIQLDTYATTPESDDDLLAGFDAPDAGNSEADPPYLSEEEKAKVVMDVQKIVKSFQADNFKIKVAGSPVIIATVKQNMRHDMMLFIRLALAMVALCLVFMFRRLPGVLLPLIVVTLSLLSTLAVMAALGVPIKLPTMILPSFILAVGVGDSVHILSLFFHRYDTGHDKKEAIVHTMGHSGLAVVMTSLTTAGGLLSFVTAEIAPVFDLGIFAAIGVIIALLYTILFLPAMLAVIPMKPKHQLSQGEDGKRHDALGHLMDMITEVSTGHAKKILLITLVLVLVAGAGLSKLRFSHDVLAWLPDKLPVHQATKIIDQEMHGSVTLELVLDSGRENGLYDPEILNKIEKLAEVLEGDQKLVVDIGKVMAVTDILKEINQALHENQPEYYAIPQEKKLIPQEFLLFENSGSDDLEDVIDSRFQQARITIKVPWQDAMNYVPFIQEIEAKAHKIFGPDVTLTTTGIMSLFGRIIYASMYSAATSYMIAAVVITLMMIFLVGSLRLGLVSMLPNIIPIVITMGMMGWFGISLNMFTMLIGSIAIGLAVDDTIHFVYHFRRYFSKHPDPVEAVRQTMQTSGRAMLTTTVVLSLGFFLFMFASMKNLFHFGLLTGIALILALSADFFLAPALFSLLAGSKAGKDELLKR